MQKPVLLTVDDDREVLKAIERDLRHHFRSDYRVVKASSGAQALETLHQLLQRGDQVALFLVDERMPQMSGTQFLLQAIKLYPDARRVLLTAYADTDTAITAINQVGLDHYLLKRRRSTASGSGWRCAGWRPGVPCGRWRRMSSGRPRGSTSW